MTEKCANYIKEIKTTNNPRLWLEIAVVDMANLMENTKLEDLQTRLSALEGEGVVSTVRSDVIPHARPKFIENINDSIKNQPKEENLENKDKKDDAPIEKNIIEQDKPNKNEDFTPMPKAKTTSGDDVLTMWGNLLANVPSAPTRALLKQWAKPVKISSEEVILAIKNEIYLQQFVSGSKKAVLQKAVDDLLGQENTKITVRLPHPDDVLPQGNVNIPKSNPVPSPVKKTETIEEFQSLDELKSEKVDDVNQEDDSDVNSDEKLVNFSDIHSDTVNMVMDLFDGKVIE